MKHFYYGFLSFLTYKYGGMPLDVSLPMQRPYFSPMIFVQHLSFGHFLQLLKKSKKENLQNNYAEDDL